MRIAFLGKGGAGKTTLAVAFSLYVAKRQPVLVIDADINGHLKLLLGDTSTIDIGHRFTEIAAYVVGTRKDITTADIVATTPPATASRFITCHPEDTFLKTYATYKNNIHLLSIGTFLPTDIGHTCYHSKLNTLELLYHHLLDSPTDVVVADTTAGVDNLGTSLFFAYDLNVFVVEPTQKSVKVYNDFKALAESHNLAVKVLVNKYEANDASFIEASIPKEEIIGMVSTSNAIRSFEQGEPIGMTQFLADNAKIFEQILQTAHKHPRNWDRYYSQLLSTHKKNSLEWWNNYYQKPIDQQYDPSFHYQNIIWVKLVRSSIRYYEK